MVTSPPAARTSGAYTPLDPCRPQPLTTPDNLERDVIRPPIRSVAPNAQRLARGLSPPSPAAHWSPVHLHPVP